MPKALYTIGELAALTGMSTKRILRVLEVNKVRTTKIGRGRVRQHRAVTLSELKRGFPDLWESMLDRLAIAGE